MIFAVHPWHSGRRPLPSSPATTASLHCQLLRRQLRHRQPPSPAPPLPASIASDGCTKCLEPGGWGVKSPKVIFPKFLHPKLTVSTAFLAFGRSPSAVQPPLPIRQSSLADFNSSSSASISSHTLPCRTPPAQAGPCFLVGLAPVAPGSSSVPPFPRP